MKHNKWKRLAAGMLAALLGMSAPQICGTQVLQVHAAQSRTANFDRNYTLGNDGAQNLAAVAQAQIGRRLGYTENWCADFVSDCADLAGLSNTIPRNANVTQLYNAVIRAGGTEVSRPQRGDLIFYKCNCMTRPLLHVGIILDNTYSAEGNLGALTNPVQKCDSYYFCHSSGGNTHSVQDGIVQRVYVRPQYQGTSSSTGREEISVYFNPYNQKYSVGTSNAVLSRTITVQNASIQSVSEVGIFLYDAYNNQIASKGERPVPVGNQINAWYDVNKELGKTLTAGTTYRYKFYAVINQNRYESSLLDFTTQNKQVSVTFSAYSRKYSIGRTNATVSRTIKVSNASIRDVSKVGIILYDANSRVLATKQETPVPVGSQINAWYDINRELRVTLRRNTLYRYQFTAVIGGITYYSNMMSFTTTR